MKVNSALEAVSIIESGQSVFVHTAAATPAQLVEAMSQRAPELRNVKIYHMHTEGNAPYADEAHYKSFEVNSLFLGGNVRQAHQAGRINFIPCFLSEVPVMIRSGVVPVDVALIQVSPPDLHGYCSLGVSIDATKAAVDCASVIIAQVNPRMPRTHGDGMIHINDITRYFETVTELPELPPHTITPEEASIGQHIAGLIDDRATLQMGIGAIPDAVLSYLGNHKDLGVHTEMFSDGVIPLMEKGVITNRYKKLHRDFLVSGFMIGSRKLYDFVDDNPVIRMLDIEYVNDTKVIRKIDNMISINSAIEVDLTGQVCADSIGTKMYSGVGGQMDFIRGASLSKGGKPIIALTSTTRRGESKISHVLKSGAGVVTTRAHVQYVVTEYGVANLYGKNLRQRAKSLIEIAHPNHREALEKAAFERFR